MSSGLLLGVALLVLSAVVALLWPEAGLLARLRRGRAAADRVAVEDALKHLWDGEYRRQQVTLQSLAGALGLAGREAAELVTRLARLGLVEHHGVALGLTGEGRSDALRVVRIHRLWERYLADETGLRAEDWHAEAERREHRTSDAQAERLAAQLGHPLFDPHGDPIPQPSGELPPERGVPLPALPVGAVAEIVHVEDEPEAVFAQLAAAGLVPGVRVRILEREPGRIRLAADSEELVLAPVVAANLTALPLHAEESADETPSAVLAGVPVGRPAEVTGLAAACRGAQRRRLLDLGFVPGTRIVPELVSPGGDPTAYRVRGTLIALRREQAEWVRVRLAGATPEVAA